MRPKERIRHYVSVFNPEKLKTISRDFNVQLYRANKFEFYEFWLENPDLRLIQALICFRAGVLMVDEHYFSTEDIDYFMGFQGEKQENVKYWGSNYKENGKRRKNTKWVLLKELDTDHIINIVTDVSLGKYTISEMTMNYFKKRIKESK